ncbi:unnamed protein product [Rangifer tarandus platyrhynchus]|uniref:Uncharacterized protein n=2 Tax=Rangifer tarandus platyrhynchus TaxID=3082113 RepID=A0ABN8Y854_RANTA|nr:unnamed protein product [Rangifer tarandus platyrhynchus]CAI9696475.1 unnamed protein product [Rangifer tarandus platyrhynchus]
MRQAAFLWATTWPDPEKLTAELSQADPLPVPNTQHGRQGLPHPHQGNRLTSTPASSCLAFKMPGRLPLRSEPPLGGWPGLDRAAGALTQPQPAQPGLGSAPRAPCPAPRGTGQHAPQRAHWTASPGKHCGRTPGPCGAGAQRGRGTGASRGALGEEGWSPAAEPAGRPRAEDLLEEIRRLEETRTATRGRDPSRWHGALGAPGWTGEAGPAPAGSSSLGRPEWEPRRLCVAAVRVRLRGSGL